MVMAVSSSENEIANTMVKSVIHIGGPPCMVCTNPHNLTRETEIGSIKKRGRKSRHLASKRLIPSYIDRMLTRRSRGRCAQPTIFKLRSAGRPSQRVPLADCGPIP